MGISRTSFAWLAASLAVGIVTALPHVTLANDVGPGKEVRAIRHDLPIIVRNEMFYPATPPIQIDGVAVDRSSALVQWHDSHYTRISSFARRYDRWWLSESYSLGECGIDARSSMLAHELSISDALASAAASALPAVAEADKPTPTPSPTPSPGAPIMKRGVGSCDRFYSQNILLFEGGRDFLDLSNAIDRYGFRVAFAPNTATESARIGEVSYRAPTEAESWLAPSGNSYFFFSGTVQSDAPIHVDPGTTIDVWFPFVLDPNLHYDLTIAYADKPIGPIDGTLEDNVVHFVLPAFSLSPGQHLMGEIEGDAWLHNYPR